jgi:hypothetical protein
MFWSGKCQSSKWNRIVLVTSPSGNGEPDTTLPPYRRLWRGRDEKRPHKWIGILLPEHYPGGVTDLLVVLIFFHALELRGGRLVDTDALICNAMV